MRVLVTGGAGFIGSWLVERLCARGDAVTIVDPAAAHHERARVVRASVLDAEAMTKAIRNHDAVVHLAGFVHGGMRKHPYQGVSLQIQGTLNVLEASRANGVSHLAYASSFYVYDGLPADATVDEETLLQTPRMELFGSVKLMGEALCREWAELYGLGTAIFRLGPAYGGAGSSAVDEFVALGLAGRTIEVWGKGARLNQYTYVGDLVDGIGVGLTHDGETYNLVAPDAVTLRGLADHLVEEYGFQAKFDDARPEGRSFPFIASRKAIERLDWRPLPLHEGLRKMVGGMTERSA